MRLVTAVLALTLIGVSVFGRALAEDPQHDHDSHDRAEGETAPAELVLPDHLREKLIVEMRAISQGMGLLLTQLSMGDADSAATVAGNIRDTFILKQELSQEELQELISLLPEGFIMMDRAFHGTAGKLSSAAASGDFNSAIEHFTTMSRACVSCHASYAAQRFPSLTQ
jgi:hypothetical protein